MSEQKPNTVILEGFHVCKHAVRFEADIIELVTPSLKELTSMLSDYAPDIESEVLRAAREVSQEEFDSYSNVTIRTPLAGKATTKTPDSSMKSEGLVILLDNPRDLENIGAVVRLASGMNASAVVTTGTANPWHKNALRGSQGLHFALPVLHIDNTSLELFKNRPVYAFDESGTDLTSENIPPNSVLVFGSERQGVSKDWLEKSDVTVKIPQRDGVSSYNLATSVAMGVYHTLHAS